VDGDLRAPSKASVGKRARRSRSTSIQSQRPVPLPTDLFDYAIPPHLIAQTPATRRDASRLLVVDRATRSLAHHTFADLPQFLRAGDTLFRNNAAVLPARLHAQRPSGGSVECFLLHPLEGSPLRKQRDDSGPESPAIPALTGRATAQTWRCLVRPGRKLPVGATFADQSGAFSGEIVAKEPDGSVRVQFTTTANEPIAAVANRIGRVPLPPYIEREKNADARDTLDLDRYQTVYADRRHQVAVAAPTAGLHFTPVLLATLATLGVRTADMTLHVGLGTFKPIATDTVEAHEIHRELYDIPAPTQRALFPPLTGRRIAVGTTSVRTIEDFLAHHPAPLASDQTCFSEASIFIYPPRAFLGVDALITNFHQPRSTLLCLVAAFLTPGSTEGVAWAREIYAEAIARDYRFFSYGDAMLIL
jgi:S-adenosylmethionine:tRNA ribosyltransferase-isomerase